MTITSISRAINGNFISGLFSRNSSSSSSSSFGSSSSSDAIFKSPSLLSDGLRSGARIFGAAVENLNVGISFLNQTQVTLKKLVDITERVVSIAEQASKSQTSSSQRAALGLEFKRLGTEFNKVLDNAVEGDLSALSEEDLTNTLVGIGLDPKTSSSVAAVFGKFRFSKDDAIGSDTAQAPRPISYATDRRFEADGTFAPAVTLPTLSTATNVQAADFNGDTIPDLIEHGSVLGIRFGTGDGSFGSAITLSTSGGDGSPTIGDFNSDGALDIISPTALSPNLQVLLGNGDGTFQTGTTLVADAPAEFIESADLNDDGVLDVISGVKEAGGTTGVSVFIGNGDGTFAAAMTLTTTSEPIGVTVGDFNGDGRKDLATLEYGTDILSVFNGNGDGTFAAATTINSGIPGGPYGYQLKATDVNLDGRDDLIASSLSESTINIFLGTGAGTFSARTSYSLLGAEAMGFDTADVTGDGIVDIVGASINGPDATPGSGVITILRGTGDGTFTVAQSTLSAGGHARFVSLDDATGDGVADILYGHGGTLNGLSYIQTNTSEETNRAPGRFSNLFSSSRILQSRSDAFGLLADAKAVRDELKNNLEVVTEGLDLIDKNLAIVREAGLKLLDLSNTIQSATDAETIAYQVAAAVRSRAPGAASQVGNLNAIISAVFLSNEAKSSSSA